MSDRLRVNQDSVLLPFLNTKLKDWTRTKIKQRLKTGCVVVNGQPIKQHDYELKIGDDVEVRATVKNMHRGAFHLEILYSDSDIIVINKPAGLLSVGSADKNKQHALAILRKQLRSSKNSIRLWPVHRLDRDTSGVLMFATSREIREAISEGWSGAKKTYLAIVDGKPNPSQGKIDQPLRMDLERYQMIVGQHPDSKKAITHFNTLRTVKGRALLEVQLETGRQHQIRVHMAWLGHPVIGDIRYGSKGPRMGLHALQLSITQPKTGKRLTFEAPAPNQFLDLLR